MIKFYKIMVLQLLAMILGMAVMADPSAQQTCEMEVALTAEEQEWIRLHPKIIVGGEPDWAPFDFMDYDGNHTGVCSDYLAEISRLTGLSFEVQIDSWSGLLQKAQNQEIDMLPIILFNEDRSAYLDFTDPYYIAENHIFTRWGDEAIRGVADLNGKTLAVIKGYGYIPHLRKEFPEITLVETADVLASIAMVIEGRVDALIESHAVLMFTMGKYGISDIHSACKIDLQPEDIQYRMAVRKDYPLLKSILQKGLVAISGEQKELIHNKWLGSKADSQPFNGIYLTAEEQQWILDNPTIVVGGETDWPPFDFVDNKGNHVGISSDYLKEIVKSTGLKIQMEIDSWKALLGKAQKGEIDLLPILNKNKEREKYLLFSESYLTSDNYIFVKTGNKEIRSFNDLGGKTVAIPEAYAIARYLRDNYPLIHVMEVDSLTNSISLVVTGAAGAMIDSFAVISYTLEYHGMSGISPLAPFSQGSENDQYYMASHIEKPLLGSIIQKALDAIPRSKRQGIYKKWIALQLEEPKQEAIVLTKRERQWLMANKKIVVTGDPDWPPYSFLNKQGEYVGIIPDLWRLLTKNLGLETTVKLGDGWSDSINLFKEGEVDALDGLVPTDLRGQFMDFSSELTRIQFVIITRKGARYYEHFEVLKEMDIATVESYASHDYLQVNHPTWKVNTYPTALEGLSALSTGKHDVFIVDIASFDYLTRAHNLRNLKISGNTPIGSEVTI